MANGGSLNWKEPTVTVKVKDATDEALAAIAFQIAGLTQRNITDNGQVDTGFMRSSVYAIGKNTNSYEDAKGKAQSQVVSQKRGTTVDQSDSMAPETTLPKDASAAVVVGANYAIYEEVEKPFLFPAAEEGARQAGGTAERVYKEVVNG